MTESEQSRGLLRDEGAGNHQVTSMELFFDLVYVFAVTQLSHLFLDHLDVRGALQTGLLLLAVWWAWVYTAWTTNWLDPNQRPVRIMLIGVMAASLIMSTVLPEAFGDRGLLFAAAYVAMQIGRTLFVVISTREHPELHRNFQRILAWLVFSGVFWIAGGLASGTTRELLWIGAVAVDLIGPVCGFSTPGLGRSTTRGWSISGAHLAERCQLFLIIALGESILVTGATFGALEITPETVAARPIPISTCRWWPG